MGCNASKGMVISPENEDYSKTIKEGSVTVKYPPGEVFIVRLDDDGKRHDNENFTIPSNWKTTDNDDGNDIENNGSLIKRYPPKRIRKLMVEQLATTDVPVTTIEQLEEKLAKAEIRRQQYLQRKIDNTKAITSKLTIAAKMAQRTKNEGNKMTFSDNSTRNSSHDDNIPDIIDDDKDIVKTVQVVH